MAGTKLTTAAEVAQALRARYGLTYRSQVNLEGAIQNAVQDGLSLDDAAKFAEDVLVNAETEVGN